MKYQINKTRKAEWLHILHESSDGEMFAEIKDDRLTLTFRTEDIDEKTIFRFRLTKKETDNLAETII